MDYLDNNRLIAHYCGFNIMEPLPSYWTYDRCLRQLNNGALKSIMADLVRQLYELGIDMERIGDQASDICEIATMGHLRSPRPEHFASMAQAAISMVHRAIDAYVHKDIELAQQVELSDDIVDALFNDVKADLIAGLRGHPDRTEECLDLLMIAKYLERIGDHAVNIAEWVVYAITGLYKGEELK